MLPNPEILQEYDLPKTTAVVSSYGNGLIHRTWKVKYEEEDSDDQLYLLQKVNHEVFHNPEKIDENIRLVGDFLRNYYPDYLFVRPIASKDQKTLLSVDYPAQAYYRLFPFVKNSMSVDTVLHPRQAFEAAQQFGRFIKLLCHFPDHAAIQETLPNFHNLSLRFQQFKESTKTGNSQRIEMNSSLIEELLAYESIVNEYEQLKTNPDFRLRITHHDAKINNVLFQSAISQESPTKDGYHALCVIDYDTMMLGYFISDLGDMFRTYLCPVSEEEQDFSRITIQLDFFEAVIRGYLTEMISELTKAELNAIVYSGKFMIYMQSLRFLTDYFQDDRYYGQRYPDHNLYRAKNQFILLRQYCMDLEQLQAIVRNVIADLRKESP